MSGRLAVKKRMILTYRILQIAALFLALLFLWVIYWYWFALIGLLSFIIVAIVISVTSSLLYHYFSEKINEAKSPRFG